ncbi:uncharacterized protein F4822DRAFT_339142 [Hypoxylon trugodes]|uniref:uncharacterized protein n=1 Tax=Hypoxylon trugodes TaxID=326681 RepID=UPI0021960142|nr:uncharacterized protein F4822DRAFT_339142 [Hypoxylon trugodes]KAI1385263.1 hypothetical protein F4822DRAFT_339142 [Hypoxylon trugodes]
MVSIATLGLSLVCLGDVAGQISSNFMHPGSRAVTVSDKSKSEWQSLYIRRRNDRELGLHCATEISQPHAAETLGGYKRFK